MIPLLIAGVVFILILAAVITIIVLASKTNKPGKQCTSNSDCGSSNKLLCDKSFHECRVTLGEKCSSDEECFESDLCKSKICVRDE